jgi:hypothetical protein
VRGKTCVTPDRIEGKCLRIPGNRYCPHTPDDANQFYLRHYVKRINPLTAGVAVDTIWHPAARGAEPLRVKRFVPSRR